MKIINKINVLPWHKTKKWSKRTTHDINKIIVHQEAGNNGIDKVNSYHIGKNHLSPTGCTHFCYHFGIENDGSIIQANEITDITWHTEGQNRYAIGIMLVGSFKGKDFNGKDVPTPEQLSSLEWLLKHLMYDYRIEKKNIYGHSNYGKPACPGYAVMEFIEGFKDCGK